MDRVREVDVRNFFCYFCKTEGERIKFFSSSCLFLLETPSAQQWDSNCSPLTVVIHELLFVLSVLYESRVFTSNHVHTWKACKKQMHLSGCEKKVIARVDKFDQRSDG